MLTKILKILSIILFMSIIAGGGYYYLQHQKLYPNTDDAYIQANVVQIAPQVNGSISQIYVQNFQYVKKGQPLLDIDPKPFQLALNKAIAVLQQTIQQVKANESAVIAAESQVAKAKAVLIDTEKSTNRTLVLVKKNFSSRAEGDQATSNLQVAKAQLAAAESQLQEAIQNLGEPGDANARIQAAKAQVAQAKLNLHYTYIVAPADGYIAKFTLQQGSTVNAYTPYFVLIENQTWWADANFKETDLSRIQPGQSATIRVDMYPKHFFKGIVKNISRGSGASFAVLPPENASGNWVKVTQRFPVKIAIVNPDVNFPFRIGASCTVTIDTQSHHSS